MEALHFGSHQSLLKRKRTRIVTVEANGTAFFPMNKPEGVCKPFSRFKRKQRDA
jgi:hypothetical protein